jgi:hypothetical protein
VERSARQQERGITEEVSIVIQASEELEQDKMETGVEEEEWE